MFESRRSLHIYNEGLIVIKAGATASNVPLTHVTVYASWTLLSLQEPENQHPQTKRVYYVRNNINAINACGMFVLVLSYVTYTHPCEEALALVILNPQEY